MKHRLLKGLVLAGLLGAGLAFLGWFKLFRAVPVEYQSEEEHFKYGSVGTEPPRGVPYYIWKVLPTLFPEKLPGTNGYASFGMIWEKGRETAVGFPKMTVGFPRVGINCALCHVGTYRATPSDEPKLVLGAPSSTFDLQGYLRFLTACASDPKFTPPILLEEIGRTVDLSWLDRGLYRFLIIPQMKKALLKQKEDLAFLDARPPSGPGRVDPFNPAKIAILKLPDDHSIGNSDNVPLWNWKRRTGFGLHWDGLNTSLTEVFLNSGIGNGATRKSINRPSLQRMQDYVTKLDPPPYPFAIDKNLAARGEPLFATQCGSCHAFGQPRTGQPIPLEEVGTDPHRLGSWTKEAADRFNGLVEYPWRYTAFRKTPGYAAVALDGIWLRAPYLHNGSVPSLGDLLEAPANRPAKFYRGYDVFDPEKVGFISMGDDPKSRGFEFDTQVPGNSKQGHSYGTTLTGDEKRALVEFMKTL